MFCSKCGQKNEEGAKFCSSCGNALGGASGKDEKTPEQKAQELKEAMSKKSKESASTLYYLFRPLLRAKVLIPTVLIFAVVVFWNDGVGMYEDYQYEQKKLQEQAWLNKHQKSGVFADYSTKLIWQDDYSAKTTIKPWLTRSNYDASNYYNTSGDTATTHCSNLSHAGYRDWRLPTKSELEGLYRKKVS